MSFWSFALLSSVLLELAFARSPLESARPPDVPARLPELPVESPVPVPLFVPVPVFVFEIVPAPEPEPVLVLVLKPVLVLVLVILDFSFIRVVFVSALESSSLVKPFLELWLDDLFELVLEVLDKSPFVTTIVLFQSFL